MWALNYRINPLDQTMRDSMIKNDVYLRGKKKEWMPGWYPIYITQNRIRKNVMVDNILSRMKRERSENNMIANNRNFRESVRSGISWSRGNWTKFRNWEEFLGISENSSVPNTGNWMELVPGTELIPECSTSRNRMTALL